MINQKHRFTLQALGTHWDLCFFSNKEEEEREIEEEIKELILDFEMRFTRFDTNSLLNRYNRWEVSLNIDNDLTAMIRIGKLYEILTEWYFSLSIKSKLEASWYGKIQPWWMYDIDLWGIGKWYCIRIIRNYLEWKDINRYCINWWGDIAISQVTVDDFGPIVLQHPLHPEQFFMSINLLSGSIAWSSNAFRKRKKNDWIETWHLIDTITGKVANTGVIASHIIHQDPIIADILATSFFVMPLEKIYDLARRSGAEYCLVMKNETLLKSDWFEL